MMSGSESRCTTVAGRCASTGRDWTRARTEDASVDAEAKAEVEVAAEAAAAETAAGMHGRADGGGINGAAEITKIDINYY